MIAATIVLKDNIFPDGDLGWFLHEERAHGRASIFSRDLQGPLEVAWWIWWCKRYEIPPEWLQARLVLVKLRWSTLLAVWIKCLEGNTRSSSTGGKLECGTASLSLEPMNQQHHDRTKIKMWYYIIFEIINPTACHNIRNEHFFRSRICCIIHPSYLILTYWLVQVERSTLRRLSYGMSRSGTEALASMQRMAEGHATWQQEIEVDDWGWLLYTSAVSYYLRVILNVVHLAWGALLAAVLLWTAAGNLSRQVIWKSWRITSQNYWITSSDSKRSADIAYTCNTTYTYI